ncbi:MAG TPA: cytochrome c oxidase subunit II [Vicinamibacterales bacterium]|nr:cytochrome c oxidase subunit II [Vicinamibacterales bacterium]
MLQSALNPAGTQAQRIEALWWLMFWVTGIVTVVVLAFLAVAIVRGRRRSRPDSGADARLLRYVAWSTAATVVVLLGLLVSSIVTGRAMASQRANQSLIVEVTANQWWWNVEYQHPEPEQRVRTANELHLPTGRTVMIKLLASDVIHSFWVPSLHGKLDAIPGHSAELYLQIDKPGVYRGQCAEYCGVQHAHMAFVVVAEEPDAFERWIQAQRTTALDPQTEQQRRGRQLVQAGTCAMCHTVRGTSAGARRAPDLTHLATRATLAAGTLPFTREHLTQWLDNPQRIKPGTKMPRIGLSPGDRDAIVAYLEQLK